MVTARDMSAFPSATQRLHLELSRADALRDRGNRRLGTLTLTTAAPLPVGTTATIPYNATRGTVQTALEAIVGAGNVAVTGRTSANGGRTRSRFRGTFGRAGHPDLTVSINLTGNQSRRQHRTTTISGGAVATPDPDHVDSQFDGRARGEYAQVRVIIDGSNIPSRRHAAS